MDSLEPDSGRIGIVVAEKARSRLARLGIREAERVALLEGGYVRTKYGMGFDLLAAGGIAVWLVGPAAAADREWARDTSLVSVSKEQTREAQMRMVCESVCCSQGRGRKDLISSSSRAHRPCDCCVFLCVRHTRKRGGDQIATTTAAAGKKIGQHAPSRLATCVVRLAGCPADEQGERGAPTREREGVEKEVGRTDNWSDTRVTRNLTQQESGGGCPHGIKATCIAGTTNERLLAHALPSCCPGAQSLALLLLMHWYLTPDPLLDRRVEPWAEPQTHWSKWS